MDKEIVRMTIVYADGSMDIMIRQINGTFSVEKRRKRWWIAPDVKGDLNQPKHIICVGMDFVISVCR